MKITKIIGKTEHLEYENTKITHCIVINNIKKTISILGSEFGEQELKQLSDWIEKQKKENSNVTIIYRLPKFQHYGEFTPYGFSTKSFPFAISEKLWNKYIGKAYNREKFDHLNSLGNELTKIGTINFILEGSANTPSIEADYIEGEIKITGLLVVSSYIEFVGFFEVIFAWIEYYFSNSKQRLKVYFGIDYSTLLECFPELIQVIIDLWGERLLITWLCFEDDMKDEIDLFSELKFENEVFVIEERKESFS